jgi:hypothetical protein
MVRSQVVTTTRRTAAACALLSALMIADPSARQAPRGPAASPLLEGLLDAAAGTAVGTYTLAGAGFTPSKDLLPATIQVDVLRGPGRTIRVPIALGAEVQHAATARLRVMTVPGAGGTARMVADTTDAGAAGHLRFVYEFTLEPGEYEVQAAVGHPRPEGGMVATLAKSRLVVPDIWQTALAVSPLVLGDVAGPAPAGAAGGPFTFGPTAVTPTTSGRFPQEAAINVAFRVYNWKTNLGTAEAGKPDTGSVPDLSIDYLFYQQGTKQMRFFNKIKQQHLDVAALGAGFNPAAGVVAAGMKVPLAAFPFGEFELTVRVTDNRSKSSTERQTRFVVAP